MIANDFYSFSGDCYVNDLQKYVKNVRKGDKFGDVEILCVIKTEWNGQGMCEFGDGFITMNHPIFNDDECIYAKTIFDVDMVDTNDIDYVYNFVLNKKHVLKVNDIDCLTFGFDGEYFEHNFFGNRIKFMNCIKFLPGFHRGLIRLSSQHIKYKNDEIYLFEF